MASVPCCYSTAVRHPALHTVKTPVLPMVKRCRDSFTVGDQIGFEGYADDFGVPIAAVEFSMDDGETWTTCSTDGATGSAWVYWHFDYLADAPGTYRLDVRAVTAEGRVSALASSVVFEVKDAAEV